jgi:hypothetical protein
MAEIADRNKLEELKEKFESLAKSTARVSPRLSHAARDLLTAISYEDETLIDSSLNSLMEALRMLVREIVQKELDAAKGTKIGIQKGWQECVDGAVHENFDPLKKVIESVIDARIASMTGVRDELVKMLEEKDYPVENAQQLENCIRELRRFKENISKDWPTPGKPPSPLNQQAIAEARAAFTRGDRTMRKDELVWESDPAKKAVESAGG